MSRFPLFASLLAVLLAGTAGCKTGGEAAQVASPPAPTTVSASPAAAPAAGDAMPPPPSLSQMTPEEQAMRARAQSAPR